MICRFLPIYSRNRRRSKTLAETSAERPAERPRRRDLRRNLGREAGGDDALAGLSGGLSPEEVPEVRYRERDETALGAVDQALLDQAVPGRGDAGWLAAKLL